MKYYIQNVTSININSVHTGASFEGAVGPSPPPRKKKKEKRKKERKKEKKEKKKKKKKERKKEGNYE